jgi:RHS repeat-associated protein
VSLTYPAPGHAHAPASVNGVSYAYDNNGNVTADGRRTMTYDAENRLSRVVSGTLTTAFTYDGDGNLMVRVAPDGTKTLYVSPAFEVTVATAAPPPPPMPSPRPGRKVYLPWVSSSALSCSTLIEGHTIQISKHYLLGQQRIAQRDACNGATTVFFYNDLLGSTAATSAGEGTRYWPYGDMRSGSLNSTDYRFTGQRNESSINLYLMGVRWYDPYLGRWIQPDTIVPDIVNPQNLNRYSYVLNNPLRYTDPSGHCPQCAIAAVAAPFGPPGWVIGGVAALAVTAYVGGQMFVWGPNAEGNRGAVTNTVNGWVEAARAKAGEKSYLMDTGGQTASPGAPLPPDPNHPDSWGSDYRRNYEQYYGIARDSDYQVHHILPQEWREVMKKANVNIDDPRWLREVDTKVFNDHQEYYTNAWRSFTQGLNGRAPTASEVIEYAQHLEKGYFEQFKTAFYRSGEGLPGEVDWDTLWAIINSAR